MELEVVFAKALRLLHSKAHDSTEQLRQLLEDSLRGQLHVSPSSTPSLVRDQPASGSSASGSSSTKYATSILATAPGSTRTSSTFGDATAASRKSNSLLKDQDSTTSKRTLATSSASSSTCKDQPQKAEKRSYDKMKKELELPPSVGEVAAKRTRIESPKTIQPIGRSSPATTSIISTIASPSYSSSSSSSPSSTVDKDGSSGGAFEVNPSAADMAVEMGLVCLICRSFDVTSGNTLVECQECHGLYHQECHKPPISDQDVNDPRLVWYCAKCTKNMKKMVSKTQKTSKPPVVAVSMTSSAVNPKGSESVASKPVKKATDSAAAASSSSAAAITSSSSSSSTSNAASQQQSSHIFKRVEPKGTAGGQIQSASASSSSGGSSSSSNKPIGLAGLAASLSGKSQKGTVAQSTSSTAAKQTGDPKKAVKPAASQQQHQPVTLTLRSGTFAGLYTAVKPEPQGGNNGSSGGSSGGQSLLIKSSTGSSGTSSSSAGKQSTSSSSGQTSGGGNGSSSAANAAALKSSSQSGTSAGSSALMSADKRLQIMKKKAAAKMQEKRRMSNK